MASSGVWAPSAGDEVAPVGLAVSPATTHSTAPDMRTTSRMERTTGATASESVPAPSPPPARPRTRGSLLATLAAVAVSGFVWLACTQPLPYYAIAPGSAVDTSLLVSVSDDHAHPPEGRILLTTVSLGKVTLLEALEGWLDPAVDVIEERLIAPPDIDEAEFRRQNLLAMDESKKKALGVAFEALGFDAITGAGAEVVQVEAGTPADGVLVAGDAIVAVDGDAVGLDIDAIRLIGQRRPGETVTLDIVGADGAERTETVTLVARPDDGTRAYLGVALTTRDLAFDFPFEVDLRSEQIGGPSAGLAFALQVIDLLTEGELTGGATVATTGTIELDGSVGAVGGVAQKTIAVRRAGATLFLVPSSELELARRFAGADLRVEAVDSLDQALAALATVGGNGLALPDLGAEGAS